ncbi:hypothetical protein Cgig2_009284 [Carnegiea gigantea]|uniref:Secreted protein n=1 Tax=Carnegiea gigantea TaxID=171969 RepID=A0A9Q1JFJ2_9CARY|nr:hypothetical protein Cgig2_009284 [Carnegiea gigantea]
MAATSCLIIGPLLCRCCTTFIGHRWATQKPPRRLCLNLPSLSSLRRETGHDPRSWPVKFGCLEWPSEGYLKSGGLWVSGSHRPPLRRSSEEASGLCRSRGWVCRNFLSPQASFRGGFRSPTNFPAAGVSPEFFLFISSSASLNRLENLKEDDSRYCRKHLQESTLTQDECGLLQ